MPRRPWIFRAALRLVPRAWRDTVSADIDDEARAAHRGQTWRAWQVGRTALRLRWDAGADALWVDLRSAGRALVRSPLVTMAALGTGALGIGVNVATLSVLDRLVFRSLPFADPDRLVVIDTFTGNDGVRLLWQAHAVGIREQTRTVMDVGAARGGSEVVLDPSGDVARFGSATANLLRILGIRPIAGRDFTPDDRRGAEPRELLLTHRYWERRFGSATDVIDRVIGSGSRTYRVVGILPPDFVHPSPDLGGPIDGLVAVSHPVSAPARSGHVIGPLIGRLAPGAGVDDARAELQTIATRVRGEHPAFRGLDRPVRIDRLQRAMAQPYAPFFWLVSAASGFVLLVACANLGALLLARGHASEHQLALRAALGASPARLVRSTVLETVLLCGAAGAIAVGVFAAVQPAVLALVPPRFLGFEASPFDTHVLAAALAMAIATGLAASIAPALAVRRLRLGSAIESGRRPVRRGWLAEGRPLLAIEAALGVILVTGGAASVGSFAGLILKDPGFAPDGLYTMSAFTSAEGPPLSTPASRVRALRTIDAGLAGFHGEWSAVTTLPIGDANQVDPFWQDRGHTGALWGVDHRAFAVLRTPVLRGRMFTAEEVLANAPVAMLNARGAAALWPEEAVEHAIGRTIRTADGAREIIGIVADLTHRPGVAALPGLFVPLTSPEARLRGWNIELPLILRAADGVRPDRGSLLDAYQRVVPGGMLGVPVSVVEAAAPWLERPRFQAAFFGALAIIALVLAAVGLYAVTAFQVARRRHEMGVRVALGATAGDLRRSVIGGAIRPVLLGGLAGLVPAWWAARFLQPFLVGVAARDPWIAAFVTLVLLATAVLASWPSARRAARVDPIVTLRAQ